MKSYVVRLFFVWGLQRGPEKLTGFADWVKRNPDAGEAIPLFIDQYLMSRRARSTAETMLGLLAYTALGTYYVAVRSCVTPYEFVDPIRCQCDTPASLLREELRVDLVPATPRPRDT